MKIALIPPASQTDVCGTRRFQMIIPDLLERRLEYSAFYQHLAKGNYYWTMLDNGAFESIAMRSGDLLTMAAKYKAHEVIAPDTIGDPLTSLDQLAEFLSKYRHPSYMHLRNISIMAVIQGTTLTECKNYVDRLARFPDVQTLGIPKHLPKTTKRDDVRTKLVEYIFTRYHALWEIHALGYVAPGETMALADLGVRSMDTAAPFVYTAMNQYINDGPIGARRQDNYANLPAEYFHPKLLEMNIAMLDQWATYSSAPSNPHGIFGTYVHPAPTIPLHVVPEIADDPALD